MANGYLDTIKRHELFKYCCYHDRPKVFLRALRIYGRKNGELVGNSVFVEKYTQIKNVCDWCDKKIEQDDFDYFAGCWTPNVWRPTHKDCKKPYKDFEVKECQTIDANCNDCKFFKRGEVKGELLPEHKLLGVDFMFTWKEERSWEFGGDIVVKNITKARIAKTGETVTFNGFCLKKNIPTHAQPNTCTNLECFEHRKS